MEGRLQATVVVGLLELGLGHRAVAIGVCHSDVRPRALGDLALFESLVLIGIEAEKEPSDAPAIGIPTVIATARIADRSG